MKLHEYQAKARFASYGIPVPAGGIATTPYEARLITERLGGRAIVKAQVLASGRSRRGAFLWANTPEEAEHHARTLLHARIFGFTINKVLVEQVVDVAEELYLAITNDRSSGQPVLVTSTQGGVDVEALAISDPESVQREMIRPLVGLHNYQIRRMISNLYLQREQWHQFEQVVSALYRCYVESDAMLAEVNPLAITPEGELFALDSKLIIDDNALYRQPELAALRDLSAEEPTETLARKAGLNYVKLEGQIGCMVNGAGLAMTLMDLIDIHGDRDIQPANFLDIGGGAEANKIAEAMRIILTDPDVKVILISIFGGITRCDEVAMAISHVYREGGINLPLIVRLQGNRLELAHEILSQIPNTHIIYATTMTDAVQKAVAAAKGVPIP